MFLNILYAGGKLEEHSSGNKFLDVGAGLELALVKRIMQGHGSLNWVTRLGSREET